MTHTMEFVKFYPSGAQEFSCNACERSCIVQLPADMRPGPLHIVVLHYGDWRIDHVWGDTTDLNTSAFDEFLGRKSD